MTNWELMLMEFWQSDLAPDEASLREMLIVKGFAQFMARKEEAAQQSVQSDGANVRPFCRNHEIYYDFELGCPACLPRR